MPLYDYKCEKCGYLFEVEQKISEEPLKSCPKCKGKIRRLIAPVGVVFKGSGFHVTDYSKDRKPAEREAKPQKESAKPAKTPPKETKNS